MKSSKLIMGCLATLGLSTGASSVLAEVDRDAIAERLRPVGQLCLQGEDCGTVAASANGNGNGEAANGIDGGAIYNQVCMACHDTGAAAAPRRGEEEEWADRIGKGWDTLLDHSINGFNAMPARGGNPNLSDEEVAASTAYLLEPVMDVPEDAVDDGAAAEEAPADEPAAEAATDEDAAADDDAVEDEAEAAAIAAEEAPADDAAVEEETTDEAAADDDAANGEPAHAGIDGEAIYNQACMACHMTGAAGAPVRGDEGTWGTRLEQDMDTLYDHAINGIGAMPPKGGHMRLSDDEVRAATDFLVEPLQ
ncbi:c-type cytochrome [Billgrantia endophytica]|uniref:Cytochrome c5 family protein n=1 Tax=Billgrantia endophytica TaxID=2033802 RepID=A0A2N7U5S6_9GAMM|nr:c-type cytochrome [Halomonas endophytica]PMR75779.1 cytochrome c5 family protein [Halomonas endophytica]